MKIQMVDLNSQYKRLQQNIDANMNEVISTSNFINGKFVQKFCEALASYHNCHAVTCGNGTDALQIALMSLELQPGDEVIVPVHTYVATAEAIALLQLTPVFIDVTPDTFTIDITQLEKKRTNKTKAIVPVHLYGQCCDMEPLLNFAKKHQLFVVEDTAQAIGAEYKFSDGTIKKAGTMGDVGTTSFFPSKNLGCFGDGGALLFQDQQLATKAKMIANHGQSIKYKHDIIGCNSRLDTLQAAVLLAKLPHLDDFNRKRNDVANYYDKSFESTREITIPKRSLNSTHVFHQYTVKIAGIDRDQLKQVLTDLEIPSMIYYPIPLHQQEAYKKHSSDSYPVTENLSKTVLSLPIHTEMTKEQLEHITTTVLKSVKSLR